MKKLKFGYDIRNHMTGSELYIRAFQLLSLLPLIFIITATGHMKLITERSLFSTLFEFGISCLPRWESLLASTLYQSRNSEIAAYFFILLFALLLGLIAGKFLPSDKTGKTARLILAAFIILDLIIRLLPFRFNAVFGSAVSAVAFVFRAACLVLILLDLRAEKKKKA